MCTSYLSISAIYYCIKKEKQTNKTKRLNLNLQRIFVATMVKTGTSYKIVLFHEIKESIYDSSGVNGDNKPVLFKHTLSCK